MNTTTDKVVIAVIAMATAAALFSLSAVAGAFLPSAPREPMPGPAPMTVTETVVVTTVME